MKKEIEKIINELKKDLETINTFFKDNKYTYINNTITKKELSFEDIKSDYTYLQEKQNYTFKSIKYQDLISFLNNEDAGRSTNRFFLNLSISYSLFNPSYTIELNEFNSKKTFTFNSGRIDDETSKILNLPQPVDEIIEQIKKYL